MNDWEFLEEYLTDRALLNQEFNSVALAEDLRITRHEASVLIQNYLKAQRRANSHTLYVLSRRGRTVTAMWHVGSRTRDVRSLTKQCLSDMSRKVSGALEPDLARMMNLNPRCARLATAFGDVFVANLNLLATQLEE
jgi:hypothetical protein